MALETMYGRELRRGPVVASVAAAPPTAPQTEAIPVRAIALDGGTQMRAGLDAITVAEYAQVMVDAGGWGKFPPVILYYDGTTYWPADGFHRLAALKAAGQLVAMPAQAPAVVHAGTRRDAIQAAAGANAEHGLRRTDADKRRAVDVFLADPEWAGWADGQIAKVCKVSRQYVNERRGLQQRSAAVTGSLGAPVDERRYLRAGVERAMATGAIGAKAATAAGGGVAASAATGTRPSGAALARCSVCKRPLSDPASAVNGMGPCCAQAAAKAAASVENDAQAVRAALAAALDLVPVYQAATGDAAGAQALRAALAAALGRLVGDHD